MFRKSHFQFQQKSSSNGTFSIRFPTVTSCKVKYQGPVKNYHLIFNFNFRLEFLLIISNVFRKFFFFFQISQSKPPNLATSQ